MFAVRPRAGSVDTPVGVGPRRQGARRRPAGKDPTRGLPAPWPALERRRVADPLHWCEPDSPRAAGAPLLRHRTAPLLSARPPCRVAPSAPGGQAGRSLASEALVVSGPCLISRRSRGATSKVLVCRKKAAPPE